MSRDVTPQDELVGKGSDGGPQLFAELLAQHRQRLRTLVELRMDRRLQGRIDPSDVIQEAYLEAAKRLPEYLRKPDLPFFVWLRLITLQKLALMYRRHLNVQARSVRREVSLFDISLPEEASELLACQLLGRRSSPSDVAERAERREQLQDALTRLDEIDREVLVLRHFEELTNLETAAVLELKPTAASNRYVRALRRLEEALAVTNDSSDN
jgi:RNA polymerase sigma-70 factor (ECF subfamily)